ncbi:TlpA family protein disulfide reductase [Mucilaginibacter myungsuensis]|uniref:TlpA family protein disulfide reductase n=1 Tax=Mucilaginibacter myungsuensis TaxID=649104 RepID=A0A929PXT9_9SPHI|nr:TlpA disulfide reductase family protein [Mucilaginibacter myungsuensis]MBE9662750.1 TlpA family protein disulfide reductase [Mucilaginibacter myungsuensis]MDN3598170.1 TlpA disulfide reductase family protein [Mucilaginibacter myungsuensis]
MSPKIRNLLLLFLALLMNACQRRQNDGQGKQTLIEGRVTNLQVYPRYRSMTLSVKDYGGGTSNYTADIKKDGSFKIRFTQYIAQDVTLEPMVGVLIAHPGDSIHIDIDFADIGNVKFSGDAEKTNTDLYQYINGNYVVNDNDDLKNFNIMLLKEYKIANDALYADLMRKRQEFINEHDPNDEFKDWTANYLRVNYINTVSEFTWRHFRYKRAKKIAQYNADSLQAYLPADDEIQKIVNSNVFYSESYDMAIHTQLPVAKKSATDNSKMTDLTITGIPQKAEQALSGSRFDSKSVHRAIEVMIASSGDDRIRQVRAGKFFEYLINNNLLKEFEENRPLFDSTINIPFIREPLLKNYAAVKENKEQPEIASAKTLGGLDTAAKAFIQPILQKHQGKVIYLYLWGTWCPPCVKELPKKSAMMERFKGKNVDFVFICMGETGQKWQEMIRQFHIEAADNYFTDVKLTNSVWKGLVRGGIPYSILINKKGVIVESGHMIMSDHKIFEQL